MGANQTTLEFSQEGLKKFQENFDFSEKFKDFRLGTIDIYRERQTGRTIAVLKNKYKSEDDYKSRITDIDDSMKLVHNHLLHVVGHSEAVSKGIFTEYEVSIYFEWYHHTLEKELSERKAKKVFFQEKEVLYIMNSLISLGAYLQEQGVVHGDIRPNAIYLNDSGKVKLSHNWLLSKNKTGYAEALEGDKEVYLSPEFLHEKGEQTPEPLSLSYLKNDVFSMGLTLVHIATLDDQNNCYDHKNYEIDFNVISESMNKMLEHYSKATAMKIKTLLEFYPEKRNSFIELRDSTSFKSPNFAE